MSYDIPDKVRYKEKIIFNLDGRQLIYALMFGVAALLAYNLPINGDALCRIFEREIQCCIKPKRRARSCLRAVRQPIKGWPRMLRPAYAHGPWRCQIIRTAHP